MLARCSRFS